MRLPGFVVAITAYLLLQTGILAAAPPSEISILDYGAKGGGKELCTEAIDRALKACTESGGGTVLVPAGTFLTGPIRLPSHVTLRLAAGAVLQGSSNLADYQVEGRRLPLLWAQKVENIAIVGLGVIDGSGTSFMDMTKTRAGLYLPKDLDPNFTRQGREYMDPKFGEADGPVVYLARPNRLIRLTECKNVLLHDVTLRNAPTWTVHLEDCEDVDVTGIRIANDLRVPNSDGIHCTTCRRVHISDCEISAGDDAVCVTSVESRTPGVCEDVTVTNCTLQSRSAGVRVGYGRNPIRNCTFQNLTIRESNRGLGLFVRDEGSVENILFSNIIIRTRLHTGHWWGNGEPIHLSVIPQRKGGNTGRMKNIAFSNIIAESESGIVIYGSKPGDISNVTLDGVTLHIRNSPLNASYGGNFDLRPAYDTRFAIFKHDIPAVFSRYTDGLAIHRFELQWDDGLPDFFSHAIFCEHFNNFVIDAFHGRQPHRGGPNAAIALQHGRDAIIRNCIASEGTATFLSHEDATGNVLLANNDLAHAGNAVSPQADNFTLAGNLVSK
jgi:hypothetical protein